MSILPVAIAPAVAAARRYISCLRPVDVAVLQGTPLLGALFAMHEAGVFDLVKLAILLVANVLLVAHVFLLNDWAGLAADLADPDRAGRVFTARGVGPRGVAALTVALLLAGLLLFAYLGAVALALALAITTLSALYSLRGFDWKGRPVLSSAAHLLGGTLHFLLGDSVAGTLDLRALAAACFFALLFAAGHLTQEIRDHRGDALNGIRTNAVGFGPRRTFRASLLLFTLAHVLLLVLAARGIVPRIFAVAVLLFPLQILWSREAWNQSLTYASISRLQRRYRALYTLVGFAMVVTLCVGTLGGGRSGGAVVERAMMGIDRQARGP